MEDTIKVKKRQEKSGVLAMLQTVGFFVGIIVVGYFFFNLFSSYMPKPADLAKDYKEVTFNTLSGFDYYTPMPGEVPDREKQKQNVIPAEIKALNGKKIWIVGFMLPYEVDDNGGVSSFVLNGNQDMCYFGAPTRLNDWIGIRMKAGKKAPFSHRPMTVYGELQVSEEIENGEVVSIYRMFADAVVTENGTVK